MADETPQPKVLDNPHSPDVFADDALSFSVLDGTVRITFSAFKFTQPPPGEGCNVVVGRLVMPQAGAERLALGLFDFLKSRGLTKMATPNQESEKSVQ